MRFTGEHRFGVPRDVLWDALHDPEVLARVLPGCQRFEAHGSSTYLGTLTLGVAGARGSYRGKIEVVDADAPSSCRLLVVAAGTPGTLEATTAIRLESVDDSTILHHEVDATLGDGLEALGSQLLRTAAQRLTTTFVTALHAELARAPDEPDTRPPATSPAMSSPPTSPSTSSPRRAARRWFVVAVVAVAVVAILLRARRRA